MPYEVGGDGNVYSTTVGQRRVHTRGAHLGDLARHPSCALGSPVHRARRANMKEIPCGGLRMTSGPRFRSLSPPGVTYHSSRRGRGSAAISARVASTRTMPFTSSATRRPSSSSSTESCGTRVADGVPRGGIPHVGDHIVYDIAGRSTSSSPRTRVKAFTKCAGTEDDSCARCRDSLSAFRCRSMGSSGREDR